jgi:hypothetical protein
MRAVPRLCDASYTLAFALQLRKKHGEGKSTDCLLQVRLYNILPHYLINGTILEKKSIEHKMCVLIFFTAFICNILVLRTERDMITHVY